jgi:hypothetical protein
MLVNAASTTQAVNAATPASSKFTVKARPKASHSPSPGKGPGGSSGHHGNPGTTSDGGTSPTLPAGVSGLLPTGVGATLPAGLRGGIESLGGTDGTGSIGALPGPSASPGIFPKVSPSQRQPLSTLGLPSPRKVRVADVSAAFPLDKRLIGVQLAGLAVLAAAVTIVAARLSRRGRGRRHRRGGESSSSEAASP